MHCPVTTVTSSSVVTVAGAATLAATDAGDFSTLASASTSNVTYDAGSFLGFDTGTEDVTYSGDIGDSYPDMGLAKLGTATLTLAGNDTYNGNTAIVAGTLQVCGAGAIPSGPGYGNIEVDGTLDLNGYSVTLNGLSGSGTVMSSASAASTLTVGAQQPDEHL